MKFPTNIYLLPLLFPAALAGSINTHKPPPNCPSRPVSPATQAAIFLAFFQKFYIAKNVTNAFLDHVSPSYIQHNPYALDGRDAAIAVLSPFIPAVTFDFPTLFNRAFEALLDEHGRPNGTAKAFVHYKMDIPGVPPQAVVDVFRMEGSCVIEHWDVGEARPADGINPNALW
jgi:predicted SnoaL-like aldol condensation-catalyzing enzyme